jgi:two-component system, OmpR family, alkaline phosphatase synthesis response regulator PhoP
VKHRILVVDDNPRVLEVLEVYLADEGFEVETAADGEEAETAVARQRPDLAILDVMLPGVDGIELTRRFQSEYDLPVILLTARTDEVDRVIGLGVGADDYVGKPFGPREVVARVRAVLRRVERSAPADEGPVRVEGLAIDPLTRGVTLDGRQIELTRTEFEILATLAAHPGRVYTRMQLVEIVQGDAFEGYERTVDAHVKNLRRKLGEDRKQAHYVQTVIGVGYKLEYRP